MARQTLHQSIEYIQLFSTLAAGAIVTWIVWELTAAPLSYTQSNATGLVAESNQWFQVAVQNLPVFFLFIAAMGSIAWTVYKSNFV
jgi:uncharacterized membrane protein YhdT